MQCTVCFSLFKVLSEMYCYEVNYTAAISTELCSLLCVVLFIYLFFSLSPLRCVYCGIVIDCVHRLTGPSGYLTDGPGNYKHKTKCTWLIEGQ